ncbi:MAG TPA: selenoneine biosynthesis selenosugar synthase SenB [Burkholderiales bacterium]|nr:selenoneine biosynthesis selenosugar synthase SenB [Burkholderiales bacterium]
MRICIVTPARPGSRSGNRNTAARWAAFLRAAGHRVRIEQTWSGAAADVLVALHARRSHDSIAAYAARYPQHPLVVVLTGTDVYRDIVHDASAQRSLELATKLVVLQDAAIDELAPRLRAKTRAIYQSARAVARAAPLATCFEFVVSGHLRAEKDPFRGAAALAHIDTQSRAYVTHIGGALDPGSDDEARAWMAREPRYRWLGELPHWRAMRMLARARAMVISSRMEGGANVVSEALTIGVPVIASDISGNIGMLGRDYPGYYAVGDERALADAMRRAESDPAYYARLEEACRVRGKLVTVERERGALESLIAALGTVRPAPEEVTG